MLYGKGSTIITSRQYDKSQVQRTTEKYKRYHSPATIHLYVMSEKLDFGIENFQLNIKKFLKAEVSQTFWDLTR